MKSGFLGDDSPTQIGVMRGRVLNILCAITAVGVLIATRQMFIESDQFRHCCDVTAYWEAAARYRSFGLFDHYLETRLRTYAFPGLLSFVLVAADALQANPRAILAGFQVVTYLISCWFVSNSASRSRTSGLIFMALALNPFALPYLVTGLADATALVMFQFWLGLMLLHWRKMAELASSTSARRGWIMAAAFLAGLTMEIRPAYVWLPVVTLVAAVWSPVSAGKADWAERLTRLFFCTVIAIVPMIPQSLINLRHFDRWTPLPTLDLASYQINLGKANLKYATRLYTGAEPSLFYPNPFYDASVDRSAANNPIEWYPAHSAAALATITAKFISAFDFDFIEPYIRDPKPPFHIIWRWLSLALMFLGVCGVVASALGMQAGAVIVGPRLFPMLLLLGWGAVTMVTVTELRFALPMLTVFLLLASWLVAGFHTRPRRDVGFALLALVVGTAALFCIAASMRSLVQF